MSHVTRGGIGRALGGLFGVAWIAIWSAGTVFLDSMAVRGLLMQERTRRYAPTRGHIVESKVDVASDSDGGTSYEPSVHYRYTVDDHLYDGNEWGHGTKTGNHTIADQWVT